MVGRVVLPVIATGWIKLYLSPRCQKEVVRDGGIQLTQSQCLRASTFEQHHWRPRSIQSQASRCRTTRPTIQAPYYGAVMVNEVIGTGKDTRVAELPTNSSNYAAFGIWEVNLLMLAFLSPA
jgi:hypothetical protein